MTSTRTCEIVGKFEGTRIVFDNPQGSTLVGSIRLAPASKSIAAEHGVEDIDAPLGIKGEATRTDLQERSTYRFLGSFTTYFNKRTRENEKQFHFRTFVQHVPHDADGLADYLVQAGRGNGIGPAKAKRLIAHFGVDEVLEACRDLPGEVARVASVSIKEAEDFAALLNERKSTEHATIECDKLLTGRGFPKTLVRRVIREWGNKAAEMIIADPYQLMQFRGVGFRLCDKLYMELGKDPTWVDRQALCLWYAMASNQEGHSWFPATKVIAEMQSMIGGTGVDYRAAILRGKEYGAISEDHYGAIDTLRSDGIDGPVCESGNTLWLAEGKSASQEQRLAELIAGAMHESEQQTLTIYRDEVQTETLPAELMRCARCGRALTADVVYVVDDKPYGPTCIERIGVGV